MDPLHHVKAALRPALWGFMDKVAGQRDAIAKCQNVSEEHIAVWLRLSCPYRTDKGAKVADRKSSDSVETDMRAVQDMIDNLNEMLSHVASRASKTMFPTARDGDTLSALTVLAYALHHMSTVRSIWQAKETVAQRIVNEPVLNDDGSQRVNAAGEPETRDVIESRVNVSTMWRTLDPSEQLALLDHALTAAITHAIFEADDDDEGSDVSSVGSNASDGSSEGSVSGSDAASDVGSDAASDAGSDAASDAGSDAGSDASSSDDSVAPPAKSSKGKKPKHATDHEPAPAKKHRKTKEQPSEAALSAPEPDAESTLVSTKSSSRKQSDAKTEDTLAPLPESTGKPAKSSRRRTLKDAVEGGRTRVSNDNASVLSLGSESTLNTNAKAEAWGGDDDGRRRHGRR
jgi:hypothetical protein